MKSKKQRHGCVKLIELILSADVLVPDNLVMQKEELSMPVPFTVEILDAEYDSSRINDLSCRFVYGSQIIHISKEDVLSFFGQSRTVVFDIISNEADKRTDRAVNMLRNLSSFQQSMHKFTSAIILFQTSHAAPIDLSELEVITTFLVNNLVDKSDIQYGLGMRDYLGNRIRLMVACN